MSTVPTTAQAASTSSDRPATDARTRASRIASPRAADGSHEISGEAAPYALVGAVLALALGTAAFAALGLFVAGVLRAEATLALANLVYLLLMAGGGVVLPTSVYGAASPVISWLPSAALGEAMRDALVHASVDGRSLLVLAAWAAVGTLLTARTFRWE